MVFHLRVQADQLEDDEEDVPVMQLRVSFRLLPGDHLVGCVGEEALEAVEESVVIARPYLPNELSDLEGCLLYTSPSPRDRTSSRMPSSA